MKKNYWMIMICLLTGSLSGCSDDDKSPSWKELFDKEQELVKEFVKDKTPLKVFEYDVEYLGEKLKDYAYLFGYDSTGTTPRPGEFVLVNYTRKNLQGKVLDSTDPAIAAGMKLTPYFELGGPVYFRLNDNDKVIDPRSEAWQLMAEGTTGSIILSSLMTSSITYLYREYKMEKIIKGSLLNYENKLIDDYIATMRVSEDDVKTFGTDTIMKLVVEKEGAGSAIAETDSVTMWFEGEILDQFNTPLRKFAKMKDAESTVTLKVSDLPTKGLSKALIEFKLKEGDEVRLFLPSGWGYGYQGGFNPFTRQCSVPPHSTLMFTIKIISKKPAPSV